ncbi:unnamed protein product [Closterium sp. NIES-53]
MESMRTLGPTPNLLFPPSFPCAPFSPPCPSPSASASLWSCPSLPPSPCPSPRSHMVCTSACASPIMPHAT